MSTSPTVIVTARIRVQPGKEEQFQQEFAPVVTLTRSEVGCIAYDLHQATTDPSLFLLSEQWVSQAALQAHLAQPYIRALAEKSSEILAESPKVESWTPIV